MKILLSIIIFFISNLTFALEPKVTKLNNQKPERLLYIGNSYLYYNDSLHNHVRRMLEEYYQKEIERSNYKSVTISGSRLSDHNINYSLDNKNLDAEEPFELVIIQGGSGEALTEEERILFANEADKMINQINQAGAEAALYMIHAYVEPHPDTDPTMITNIKKMYIEAGNKNNALVLPIGIAFENAYSKQPKIKLHKDYDGTHPDILGTYLAACVVFASITHRSPFEIKYDYYGKVSKSDKSFLQSIAHKTVEDFYSIKLK